MSLGRCNQFGHFVPNQCSPGAAMWCDCNAVRMMVPEPMSYTETKDYVESKLIEGLQRGEHLSEILEVAVIDAFSLDHAEELTKMVKANEKDLIDFYRAQPKYEACSRCREVVDLNALVCKKCANGEKSYLDKLKGTVG
jgi:hypothetical protein